MKLAELLFEKLLKPGKVFVGKDLDIKDAWKRAFKRSTRDFRGYKNYNPKTGIITLI